jgi:hypothetical protein
MQPSGKPVDPDYYKLKQSVLAARTPRQQDVDLRMYKQSGDKRSYEDWLQQSRIDAYIRGWITPDERDEWRKNGWYKRPGMRNAVESIRKYLSSESKNNAH